MIAFIKDHRGAHGVEPICRVLQIAPSTFYERLAIERDPSRASDRAKRDVYLRKEMTDVWEKLQLVKTDVIDARSLALFGGMIRPASKELLPHQYPNSTHCL